MNALSILGAAATMSCLFSCVVGQGDQPVSGTSIPTVEALNELGSGTCSIEQDFLEFARCSDSGVDTPRHRSSTIPSEQADCAEACPSPGVPDTSECGIVWGCRSTFLPYRVPFCRLAIDWCPATQQTEGGGALGPFQQVSDLGGCIALGRALLESCRADVVYAYYYQTDGSPGPLVNEVRR